MGNGTRAFAVAAEQPEKANPLKHIEDTVEQNDNNFDGIINNTPTVDELEAKVKAGETISLVDLANAVKAELTYKGKEFLLDAYQIALKNKTLQINIQKNKITFPMEEPDEGFCFLVRVKQASPK